MPFFCSAKVGERESYIPLIRAICQSNKTINTLSNGIILLFYKYSSENAFILLGAILNWTLKLRAKLAG